MSETTEAPSGADDVRASLEAAFSDVPDDTPIAMDEAVAAERDAVGRFAAKDTPEAQEAAAEGEKKQEDGSQPVDASKADSLAAPSGWSSEAKLQWDRLPRAAQDALKADLDAGRISLGSAAQSEPAPDPVRDVVKSYQGQFQSRGLTPDVAVKALFEAQAALDRDPAGTLRQWAQSYGVSLEPQAPQAQGDQQVHPVIAGLQQELAQLKGILTQQQRDAHETKAAGLQQTIADFSSEKTADGSLARPYFNDVRAVMGSLMMANDKLTMQQAYDSAIWADPTIRTKLVEAERKATAARDTAAAAEARRKAGSVRSNPSVSAVEGQPDDVRSQLLSAWDA